MAGSIWVERQSWWLSLGLKERVLVVSWFTRDSHMVSSIWLKRQFWLSSLSGEVTVLVINSIWVYKKVIMVVFICVSVRTSTTARQPWQPSSSHHFLTTQRMLQWVSPTHAWLSHLHLYFLFFPIWWSNASSLTWNVTQQWKEGVGFTWI